MQMLIALIGVCAAAMLLWYVYILMKETIRHERYDSVCFIPCHSGCFGNSAGRIHKNVMSGEKTFCPKF